MPRLGRFEEDTIRLEKCALTTAVRPGASTTNSNHPAPFSNDRYKPVMTVVTVGEELGL